MAHMGNLLVRFHNHQRQAPHIMNMQCHLILAPTVATRRIVLRQVANVPKPSLISQSYRPLYQVNLVMLAQRAPEEQLLRRRSLFACRPSHLPTYRRTRTTHQGPLRLLSLDFAHLKTKACPQCREHLPRELLLATVRTLCHWEISCRSALVTTLIKIC
jgi:hypothetical protein